MLHNSTITDVVVVRNYGYTQPYLEAVTDTILLLTLMADHAEQELLSLFFVQHHDVYYRRREKTEGSE